MKRKSYTESYCIHKLERKGCKFEGARVFTVPKNKLGLSSWGMVDFLVNYCRLIPRFAE